MVGASPTQVDGRTLTKILLDNASKHVQNQSWGIPICGAELKDEISQINITFYFNL